MKICCRTDEGRRQLPRIVRRGRGKAQVTVVCYRRAMALPASAGGNTVETFQRTKTREEANDPAEEDRLNRIEEVLERWPNRAFAFDDSGPLAVHPVGGGCRATHERPQLLPTNRGKTCGVRQFYAC